MTAASFDSNILIDSLRGHEPARGEIKAVTTPYISRLTWIEVLSKVDDRTENVVHAFLDRFIVDEVTLTISRLAAALRNERRSLKLPHAVILASARVNGRTLVTRNTHDFPAGTPGIRVPYTLVG